MSSLSSAIAYAEGANPAYNNPGDLKLGDVGYGVAPNGVTIFSSLQDGANALQNQVNLMLSGNSAYYDPNQTIEQASSIYANGDPNWAANVAQFLGVTPQTTLAQAAGQGNANGIGVPTFGQVASALNPFSGASKVWSAITAHSLEDYVLIIVGIVLIAAGLFSFKQTQIVVDKVSGVAKKAAEIGASAA